jgi:signal peptidase II
MQKADSLLGSWRGPVLFFVVSLVVAADQLTKAWVTSFDVGEVIFKLGFFRLVHVQNTGAAFGIFQGQSFILTIVAAVGIIVILFMVLLLRRSYPFLVGMTNVVAFGMMLGGATGNLIDRLRQEGRVTDFLDVGVWPAFNVADSAIVVGVIIAAYSLLRLTRAEKQ